ncbi:hypothetical protein WMY93_022532 [Mugilogobius chulae]|uniref:Sulfotransferase n=1 Tax=Mugilogobius chulae TaxID=88201 RepID=A0AAW0NHU5_9GOBI
MAEFYSSYKGIYLPKCCTPEGLKYWEQFTFRPDDIIVATYPKSGTNWTLDLVPLVLSGGDSSLVDSVPTWKRTPLIGEKDEGLCVISETQPSPRIMASHFHYNAMPESFFQVKPKVINVMRNPKDVLVSCFHYFKRDTNYHVASSLTDFLHLFLEGEVSFSSWFDHVKSWLNVEDKSHILYLTYEDMLQDLPQAIKKTAEFLDKPLEDEAIERITDRCLFKNMKKHNTFKDQILDHSAFYRKGIAGDWKNHLSEKEGQLVDAVFKEKMKDVDFEFTWD